MLTKAFLLGLASLSYVVSVKLPQHPSPRPWSTFAEKHIFQPDSSHNILYPRQVELSDGSLLATASYGGDKTPYFPIFRSTDGGANWSWISNMTDQANGLGMAAQPALAEMPFAVGEFPAGTVLASGNSWGSQSTNIDIYASKDKGYTWKFVSNVAKGSGPDTTNGNPCIWEPFIVLYNHKIGVFYSDQRDPLHGQKFAHQESTDLKSWGSVIDDVAYLNYTARPRMTVIIYVPPLEKWILVHEFPGGDSWSGAGYPVYYRLADSPFDFRFGYGYPIVVDGIQPSSSPYIVWSPVGGVNGTIVVSDADHSSIFTNQANGQPDRWEIHATPQPAAYSRSLHVFAKHPDHLMILGVGVFDQVENSPLYLSVVSLKDSLRRPAGCEKSSPIGPIGGPKAVGYQITQFTTTGEGESLSKLFECTQPDWLANDNIHHLVEDEARPVNVS